MIVYESDFLIGNKYSVGSVAEWSKALVLGTSHFDGVGSNPTTATFLKHFFWSFEGVNTIVIFFKPYFLSLFLIYIFSSANALIIKFHVTPLLLN